MSRLLEMYYTIDQLRLALNLHEKTILARMNLGTEQRPDYRIPASGVNADLARRRVFLDLEPIVARSPGELRRKTRVFSGNRGSSRRLNEEKGGCHAA